MEKFTFFWRSKSPFSQWYPGTFCVNNIVFNCAEQYMMYQKAKLFNDETIAQKILQTKSPNEQKKLGRKVKNFDQKKWEQACKQIVYDGSYAKFSQNVELKKKLLATAGTTIVEASPVDRIWGVGLSEDDPRILDRTKWLGTNWLGEILTKVREDLMEEKE
ncbi:NADAR family protein [Aneurinibacillus uraniidurans]|uniref:NADAR family protein n=1 Tax=Aneurinibacillus uraniidurans TaxID=2966586 RepID=UPI00234BBD90|nr:NADAR family protein [Aneurinibacillus sp. B1]WCN36333.1 NADAR family protein [Aneurinibacillus sp. B1]